jgi:hypothetical protein
MKGGASAALHPGFAWPVMAAKMRISSKKSFSLRLLRFFAL